MKDFKFPIICSLIVHVTVIATLMAMARATPGESGMSVDVTNVVLQGAPGMVTASLSHLEALQLPETAKEVPALTTPSEDPVSKVETDAEITEEHAYAYAYEAPPAHAYADSEAGSAGVNTMGGGGVSARLEAWQLAMTMQMRSQMAVVNMRQFYKNAGDTAQKTVLDSLRPDLRRNYPGDSALVELSYDRQGTMAHMCVASATDENLAHMLEHAVNWISVASPATYNLPNRKVLLRVDVGTDGGIRVGVELL
jgi:hypothetical protein